MTGNPRPLSLRQPLDMEDARAAYQESAAQRRAARDQYERATVALAEAERAYRKGKAQAYVTVEAQTAGERDAKVDSMVSDMRFQRDVSKGLVKVAEERLAEIDADRASLHRLVDWSQRLDPYATEDRERARAA